MTGEAGTIRVRPARPDEGDRITRFNLAMAAETEGRTLDRDRLAAGVERVLADPALGFYLVAELAGRTAACLLVTYEWSDWRNGCFWWIQSVYVEPGMRKRGLFTALYREVVRRAREEGACGVRLYVEADNRAARLVYGRLGLAETGYRLLEVDWSRDET